LEAVFNTSAPSRSDRLKVKDAQGRVASDPFRQKIDGPFRSAPAPLAEVLPSQNRNKPRSQSKISPDRARGSAPSAKCLLPRSFTVPLSKLHQGKRKVVLVLVWVPRMAFLKNLCPAPAVAPGALECRPAATERVSCCPAGETFSAACSASAKEPSEVGVPRSYFTHPIPGWP